MCMKCRWCCRHGGSLGGANLGQEWAQFSDVAAEGASVELKTEQVARCQGEEKISTMTLALENATGRFEFLEKENKAITVIRVQSTP